MCVFFMEHTFITHKTLECHRIQFGLCCLSFLHFYTSYLLIKFLMFTWLCFKALQIKYEHQNVAMLFEL